MAASLITVLLIWLHIVAVVVWIGGAFFMIYLLSPNLGILQPPDAGKVGGAVGKKFTSVVWSSIAIITITGLIRMYSTGFLNISRLLGTGYGQALLLKILLFVAMIITGGMIGKTEKQLHTSPEKAMPARKKMAMLGKIVIALGIIITFIGIGLNYGFF